MLDHKTYAYPFAPIDGNKGPVWTARRAAAISLALQRAPLSWTDAQIFKLADTIAAYISGERAEEAKPAEPLAVTAYIRTQVPASKDDAGRIFVWDKAAGAHREVVYK